MPYVANPDVALLTVIYNFVLFFSGNLSDLQIPMNICEIKVQIPSKHHKILESDKSYIEIREKPGIEMPNIFLSGRITNVRLASLPLYNHQPAKFGVQLRLSHCGHFKFQIETLSALGLS